MDNVIVDKSKFFALEIIKLYSYLVDEKREFVLSKQILRSGTSIGANIREAVSGISKKEFISKLQISLKEASETEYWLELLAESNYITKEQFNCLYKDCKELLRILTSIIKSSKNSINNKK